jgi:hypothetical protein
MQFQRSSNFTSSLLSPFHVRILLSDLSQLHYNYEECFTRVHASPNITHKPHRTNHFSYKRRPDVLLLDVPAGLVSLELMLPGFSPNIRLLSTSNCFRRAPESTGTPLPSWRGRTSIGDRRDGRLRIGAEARPVGTLGDSVAGLETASRCGICFGGTTNEPVDPSNTAGLRWCEGNSRLGLVIRSDQASCSSG